METKKDRIICACTKTKNSELEKIIKDNLVYSFDELEKYDESGACCGICRDKVKSFIKDVELDVNLVNAKKERVAKEEEEKRLAKAKARVERYKANHSLKDGNDLEKSLDEIGVAPREFNNWVSQVVSTMGLSSNYTPLAKDGIKNLGKIPVIWLELASCTGDSEAFIKCAQPGIEDLLLSYISLEFMDLISASTGTDSENVLNRAIEDNRGKYILIVEGAIPTAMDGNYLRIGPNAETGVDILKRVSKDAAVVIAMGSCAYYGGVMAAKPNPTEAVGVGDIIGNSKLINIPGCPTNPMNVVGTLLHYLMFDELPELDSESRPLWAYGARIHDNCERRGHFEMGRFVKEWGDEGSKKGWCLFKMGCKGPFTKNNCSTVKFNEGTSWPVQAGHGCIGCSEKDSVDKYFNFKMRGY